MRKSTYLLLLPILLLCVQQSNAQWNIILRSDTMNYTGVDVLDRNTAWMVGHSGANSAIYVTPDGGLQWGGGVFVGRQLLDVEVDEAGRVWTVGRNVACDCAEIIVTANGGASWSASAIESIDMLTDVQFYDRKVGYISAMGGKVLRTADGGTNWEFVTSAVGVDNLGLEITPTGTVLTRASASGPNALSTMLYRSQDRGATWSLLYDAADDVVLQSIADLSFIDDNTGYAVGQNGPGVIAMTIDGGASWTESYRMSDGGTAIFLSVVAVGLDTAYAGGSDGSVYASYDRGATWQKEQTHFDFPVMAIDFRDGVGWGVGPGGSSYKTVKPVGPEGYCVPPVIGPVYGSGILNVRLDATPAIDNTSRSDGLYTFYDRGTASPKIKQGEELTVRLTTDPANIDGRNSSRVWIDFNRDGDFEDDGEEVAFWDLHQTATEQTWKFLVPGDAVLGPTIMRVFTDMPNEFGHDDPRECGYRVSENVLGQHGEVEDYTLEIVASGSASVNESDVDDMIIVRGDRVDLSGVVRGGTVRVIDLAGRVAAVKQIGPGASTIDLADFPHGTWLLEFTLDGERRLRRVER